MSENDHLSDELDSHIQLLIAPYGGPGNQRDRETALQYLLAHADEAHPRLLGLLDETGGGLYPVAVIRALPAFGRAESVPVLERLMQTASEAASMVAGEALGRHPHPSARAALLRGLHSARHETVIAAADGLWTRGDPSDCASLLELMSHANREIRYHALQAAGGLGCLSQEQLAAIASGDSDHLIRDLANRLLRHR